MKNVIIIMLFLMVAAIAIGQRHDEVVTTAKGDSKTGIRVTGSRMDDGGTPKGNIITGSSVKSDSYLAEPKGPVEGKHQISYFMGGGLSSFNFKPQLGAHKNGLGFSTGFDYSYFWHPKWGVNVGFSFDSFGSTLDLSKVETTTLTRDGDIDNNGVTDEFYLITKFNGMVESQRSLLLAFPVEIRFRQPFSPKMGMIVGLGPKFSSALSSTSQVSKGSYKTEGFYPKYGSGTYMPVGPGFDTYSPREKVKTDIGFGISIISDLDIYYKINTAFSVYAGPYFEYQLNTISGNEDKPLVQYNVVSADNANSSYNPVLTSGISNGANRLAFGGKVGLTFDFGGYKILKKNNADRQAQLLAAEALRLAELRRLALADSLANALRMAEIRNKSIADSLAFAQKMADEARRMAELRRLAQEQRVRDSIASARANANNIAVVMDIRTKKLKADELDLLTLPIIFKMGSADITDQSKANALLIGEMLSRHPDLIFQITGHTCDIGDDQANYRLGLRRAQTLFKQFTAAGVLGGQIKTFSKGETEPLVPNINENNRKRNRRVVVVIDDEK